MSSKLQKLPYYAKKAIQRGLLWAYAPPENWQRRIAQGPLYQAQRVVERLSENVQPCTYITSGVARTNQQPLKVAFVGRWQTASEPSLERYEHFIFESGSTVRQEMGTFSGSLRRQAEAVASRAEAVASSADLIAVLAYTNELWKPVQGDWSAGPAALRLVFNFVPGENWDQVVARSGLDAVRQRLRESGMRYYISHRQSDMTYFYRQMYAPTVINLGEGYGEHISESEAHALFNEHLSLLVVENLAGQMVAGAMAYPARGMVRRSLVGVLDGSRERAEQGLLAACDYFGMQWAFDLGCAQYDSGTCLPFLSGGSPTGWQAQGGQFAPNPWRPEKVLFWAPAGSQAGAAWMKANPFTAPGQPAERAAAGRARGEKQPDRQENQLDHLQVETFSKLPDVNKRAIEKGLYEHSLQSLSPEIGKKHQAYGIVIRNKNNQVVGGLVGYFSWNFLHVNSLWVSAEYRGRDLGTRLMKMAESAAREEGMDFITLETTSFEAIGFYPRLGFEVVGQIDGMPPGHTYYFMKKNL